MVKGRPKGYQVSEETRKKISEGNKGKKQSEETKQRISQSKKGTPTWNKGKPMLEETKKKLSLSKTKNRKCSIEGCNNKHNAYGLCISHWNKLRRKTDTEYRDRLNKRRLREYYADHEKHKALKRKAGKLIQFKIVTLLGGKCVSCDEKFNPELPRSNMHIHHKFYSDKDKADLKRIGITGHHLEIKRLIKNNQINELKKKFTLLCRECNQMEGFAKKSGQKTFDFFCWLYSENYFDQALKDDPKLMKLTNFMKNS